MAAIFRDQDGKGPDHSRRGSFWEKSNPLALSDRKKLKNREMCSGIFRGGYTINTVEESFYSFIYFLLLHTTLTEA